MSNQLHVVLFPFLAHGHMIPILDIARLIAARNVKTTIITTRVNAPTFTKAIETGNSLINIEIIKFPTREVGLPEGYENAELAIKHHEMIPLFFQAIDMLGEQLEQYLERVRPECIIADMHYTWATSIANKFNIPRLVFHAIGYFGLCAQEIIRRYEPFQNVSTDDEPFSLPLFPHEVKMLRSQICPDLRGDKENPLRKRMELIKKTELESFGTIVNTFYEVEPEYAELFKKLGRRAWHIGPVSLCNMSVLDKAQRGKQAAIDEHECLTWLNSKKPASVIYICFGSTSHWIAPQLHEIAMAIEFYEKDFIWVLRDECDNKGNEEWLPLGFEERTQGRCLIIRGWAPQVLILEHEAVGAFMTHCGWNSVLEGISAGVPMITWPIFAEQFYNERQLYEVLRIGVPVGVKKWGSASVNSIISRNAIEKAVREVIEGEDAKNMRLKSKQLKEMASNSVVEGGSSYSSLSSLITELRGFHTQLQN